jgi:hypothetical protein
MIGYSTIAGTWAWRHRKLPGQWDHVDSIFSQMLRQHGFDRARSEPFVWSTGLSGTEFWLRWFARFGLDPQADHEHWHAGGSAYRWYLEALPVCQRVTISYSYGTYPALYAAAQGLQIPVLVDVSGPIRRDMEIVIALARPNIGRWLYLYDPRDPIKDIAGIGDGYVDIGCGQPHADRNCALPDAGHGGFLHDAAIIASWPARGWLDYIREGVSEVA